MKAPDIARVKNVILEIVRGAGGEWVGKTKLFKAFYFAHLFYAEAAPGFLTNWPIVRMPHGPGIDSAEELIREMVLAGVLTADHVPLGPFNAARYRVTGKELPGEPLPEPARKAIGQAVEFVKNKTAQELSDLTHEFSRSWNSAHDGQVLNIYIDTIPEDEYEAREQRLKALTDDILSAWK
jgi:hypothetical protein